MDLIHVIKAESITARKNKDKFVGGVLNTLIAEIEIVGKNNGNRTSTDAESVKVIQKFKKGTEENLVIMTKRQNLEKVAELKKEIEIYDAYLPRLMTEDELKAVLLKLDDEFFQPTVGMFMKTMKERYAGLYDGKMALKICKEIM